MQTLATVAPIDTDTLGDRIAQTAALVDATTHTLLTHIREFDERDGWHRQGALSCAHWLNWRIGLAMPAAREKVRVARALPALPLIDEALRLGHWADGGHTKLDGLIELCRRHHRYVHEYEYTVERTDLGRFVFRDPGGAVIPAAGARRAAVYDGGVRIARRLRELGITGDTNLPRWDGTEPNWGLAVDVLVRAADTGSAAQL